jgi:hypothetical protein
MTEYRIHPGPDDDTLRFLSRDTFESTVVPTDAAVADLQPGNLVEATLSEAGVDPAVESLSVVRPTRYQFADAIDPVFEVAEDLWAEAKLAGEGMESQVTRNTDGEVNGVCYVFAEDDLGGRFAEFRDGSRPLDPLVDRINESENADPAPRAVFVLRPPDQQFVIVVIALEADGQFATTLRDTYDLAGASGPSV